MENVAGTTEVPLGTFGGLNSELSPTDLPAGLSPDCRDMAFIPGSAFTRPSQRRFLTVPGDAQIVYSTSFTQNTGVVVQLVFDSLGNIYADGVLIGTTAPGNRFKTCAAFGRTYIATSDGLHGADVPLQYDGVHLDRISQDGPGAPPIFTADSTSTTTYPIDTITQPAVGPYGGFAFGLQSPGPGVTGAGTNVTQYYADSTITSGDPDLIAAFNSGNPVYVHLVLTLAPTGLQTPNTVLVTGIGIGIPPGEARAFYYFTYNVPTSQALYGSGHGGYGIQYQRTLATVTLTAPAPIEVGISAVISASSVPAWDSTWNITQTLDASTMQITQSSLTSGVATFSYDVISGANPTPGQLITVTGTLNANGTLNIVNGTILTVVGTNIGTLTVGGFSPLINYPPAAETGSAETQGEIFTIEPGLLTLGTINSPIYGNATGGDVTLAGTGVTIAPGKRQGVVFFITRTGYTTAPSPYVTFFIPNNTTNILVTNLPIGPPNVIARGVAFTGANGGKFFYLPVAPMVNGLVNGTSTVVNDNTTTAATFNFSDQALLAATAIDIPGNNLFRQVVLGPCLGVFPYAGRLFAWGERNKIQQFLNMGFEGGYVTPDMPLGWTVDGTAGALVSRGDYGQAWQVTGSGLGSDGQLTQPAFQDENGVAILQPLTRYTFRLWTRGLGIVVAELYSPIAGILASASIAVRGGAGGFTQGQFGVDTPAVIPADTVLRYRVDGLGVGEVATLDEVEVYYTANPYLTYARGSYVNNPEAFDGVTGIIGPANDPNAIRAMFERKDVLHMLTSGPNGSLYEADNTPSGECSTWNIRHIAAKCGAISVWGDAQFEDWQVWASDTGLRIYDGGSVEKMSQEVQPWWDSFNLQAKQFAVVANDPVQRRIFILAATGSASIPNDCYQLDYRELNTESALANSGPLRTGYSGKVFTTDITRKWSPWSVKANYASMMDAMGGSRMTFCGGSGDLITDPGYSAVYKLEEGVLSGVDDDYGPFLSYYFPYFFVSADEAQQLQLGQHRKLYTFLSIFITGVGNLKVTPVADSLTNPYPSTPLMPMSLAPTYDYGIGLNVDADRMSFKLECLPATVGAGAAFSINDISVAMQSHPYSPIRGRI